MTYSYTNRRGRTYYLHQRTSRKGTPRHVFAKEPGEGALDSVPVGYEVRESVNGVVSLARIGRRRIGKAEERIVAGMLSRLGKDEYRLEVKTNSIVVFEPDRSRESLDEILRLLGPVGTTRRARKILERDVRYSPVLRFVLDDEREHAFHVERMTYTGEPDWSWPLGQGDLEQLARDYLPHLGQDSFFDLE